MSDTPPPDPAPVVAPSTEQPWVKPFMAVGSLFLFAAMVAVVVVVKNESAMLMLVGASIASLTQAQNYYFGSSAGSARKTEIAAGSGVTAAAGKPS